MKPASETIAVPRYVRLLSLGLAAFRFLARCNDRHFQRIDLAALDDTMLRDIGLERREAERECRKPFWRR
jgi:uncharacterized protein YjiS (DUF1127 family)